MGYLLLKVMGVAVMVDIKEIARKGQEDIREQIEDFKNKQEKFKRRLKRVMVNDRGRTHRYIIQE
ncbi:hypothetical protein Z967_11965 [Clostridium novyi A str. 4540]|nr:hypothetical protein Z967_11965 [Clostridium novyi A str. 4540]